jgi:single-stranded-DNA-specific exonuclease
MKQWKILQTGTEKKRAEEIIGLLLKNRQLKSKKQIDGFLSPPRPDDLKPEELGIVKRELKKAVKRIKQALASGEEVVIYGDYDADGICGTAILWEALDRLGVQCLPYIPRRLKEGYGLSIQGIENVKRQMPGAKLIITVDNGITAGKAIKYAQKKGMEVIITDHHIPAKKIPKALAIVHTTELCGAGVAWALAKELSYDSSSSELVAIGSIADVVPLIGPNRSLVKYGLRKLNRTERVGLLAILEESGLEKGNIETWMVSFVITPRLNAMGRLIDAMDSLRLLCTRDIKRAANLAKKLGKENRRRQQLNGQAFLDAKNQFSPPLPKILFVASKDYHEGIVGLVASNLVKEFYRPALVVSLAEEFSKGSARSIEGFDIIKAIRQCEKLCVDCGGHPMAAGFTIKTSDIERFKKCLLKVAGKKLKKKDFVEVLAVDCELHLSQLSWKLYDAMEKFAPFGVGNPKPVFCTHGLRLVGMKTVGSNGNHLKIKLDDPETARVEEIPAFEEGPAFDGIGFGMGDFAHQLKPGDLIDIAYTLEKNVWNNEERLELRIKDIKPY